MTKQIEETFNLPSLEEILKLEKENKELEEMAKKAEDESEKMNLKNESQEAYNVLEEEIQKSSELISEIIDHDGLKKHDYEMDNIAEKAIDSYEKLSVLALEVSPAHTGKIAETAANMLRISLDAKNLKADKRLRVARLQLEKARLVRDLERDKGPSDGTLTEEDIFKIDRNRLLRELKEVNESNENNIDNSSEEN